MAISNNHFVIKAVGALAISVIYSAIAYKYYEIPMRNRIRDMSKKVKIKYAVLGRSVNQ